MCTIIVTIRSVLWYVMSLAGTLMILVALFTNRWLDGTYTASSLGSARNVEKTLTNVFDAVSKGDVNQLQTDSVGLFIECTQPTGQKFFEGECIPDPNDLKTLFTELNEDQYPHAWRGAIIAFVLGLGLMVITDLFALLTICCRRCVCCSVFTVCGSVQSFAGMLFVIGLVAYPAGWGHEYIKTQYCGGESMPFVSGSKCSIGVAYWLAVAGTVATCISSSLAIWAYQSTKSMRCETRQDEGERCICLP